MSTLYFMPWCPLERQYKVGAITLLPYARDQKTGFFDGAQDQRIRTILGSYRDLEGRPTRIVTLIQYRDKPILSDLNDDEFEEIRESVELACFGGLSRRALFSPLDYVNASNFILYGQRFQEDVSFMGIVRRRRDGHGLDGRSIETTMFSIPVPASPARDVKLDEPLLLALTNFQKSAAPDEWARWQHAISCFNWANTDAENVSYQLEWSLLCSAFERLLNAKSDYEDVATKFVASFAPYEDFKIADAKRKSVRWKEPSKPLRFEWMREFYRVRGDFAHGRLETRQPLTWKPEEHLVLATISFPLVANRLLANAGVYSIGEDDVAEIDAFERFADENFLIEPPDSQGSLDSWWRRYVEDARHEETIRAAVKYWNELHDKD